MGLIVTVPRPEPNESLMDYCERVNALGFSNYRHAVSDYGISSLAAKAIWIASVEFNCRFSFDQWQARRQSSQDGYGPWNWLRRKYKLSDEEATAIVAEFEKGNDRALRQHLTFDDLLSRMVSDTARHDVERLGPLDHFFVKVPR